MTCLSFNVDGFNLVCVDDNWNWEGEPSRECRVKYLKIDSQNENITSVDGEIEYQGDHQNTTTLFIDSQIVHFLPRRIEKFFPELKEIVIINSKLKSINKSDLKHFMRLNSLDLSGNGIESLDGDLFEFNPEIGYVNFSGNQIKFVGENIFNSLLKLKHANFLENICINDVAKSKTEISILTEKIGKRCSKASSSAAAPSSGAINGPQYFSHLASLLMLLAGFCL